MYTYNLRIGLPLTNYNQLSEHLLIMQAGHFHWTSMAKKFGTPLSKARTSDGREIYATFFYVETKLPGDISLTDYKLDDDITFCSCLREYKGMSVEGQLIFDHSEKLVGFSTNTDLNTIPSEIQGKHPFIRFGNIFITPDGGNSSLRVARPANASFSDIEKLPFSENPYNLTRGIDKSGRFGLLDDSELWAEITKNASFTVEYEINPDRDSNGAGLTYFANYFAFMDYGERKSLRSNSKIDFSEKNINSRTLVCRRTAYFGNVDLTDSIKIKVQLFQNISDDHLLGIKYWISRNKDGALICFSEAIKRFGA